MSGERLRELRLLLEDMAATRDRLAAARDRFDEGLKAATADYHAGRAEHGIREVFSASQAALAGLGGAAAAIRTPAAQRAPKHARKAPKRRRPR